MKFISNKNVFESNEECFDCIKSLFFFINLMCIYNLGKSFLWIPEEIMNKIFMYNS